MEPLAAIIVMAAVTYLIRVLPLALIDKPIENLYVRSFLHYIPYAILASMTVPYIFYATGHPASALAGTGAALALAWKKRSLITVSLVAVGFAYIAELLLMQL